MVNRVDILCPQYIELYRGFVDLSAFDSYSLHDFLYLNLYLLLLDNSLLLLALYFSTHLTSFELHVHTGIVIICNGKDILTCNRTSSLIIVDSEI
jgi:hypothetical protein